MGKLKPRWKQHEIPFVSLGAFCSEEVSAFFLRSKCSQERDQHEQSSAQNAHGSL